MTLSMNTVYSLHAGAQSMTAGSMILNRGDIAALDHRHLRFWTICARFVLEKSSAHMSPSTSNKFTHTRYNVVDFDRE